MRAQVLGVEALERAGHSWPAGEPAESEHAVPVIVDRQRRVLAGRVRGEVLARQDPALRSNVVDDRRPEIAPVERHRAVTRDGLERARQIRLREALWRFEAGRRPIRRAAIAEVHPLRLGVPMEPGGVGPEDERPVPVHHEALAREANRRLEEPRPGQPPEAPVRELVCGGRPGHRHRERTLDVGVALHSRPAIHPRPRVATGQLEHPLARGKRSIRRKRSPSRRATRPDRRYRQDPSRSVRPPRARTRSRAPRPARCLPRGGSRGPPRRAAGRRSPCRSPRRPPSW